MQARSVGLFVCPVSDKCACQAPPWDSAENTHLGLVETTNNGSAEALSIGGFKKVGAFCLEM